MKFSASYLLSLLMAVLTVQNVLSATIMPTNFLCKSSYVAPYTANNYYISTTGSDSNAGTSKSAPWKTFKKANSVIGPGSTVTVASGVYYEQMWIGVSGTANAPIVFISENQQASSMLPNQANAVIDGSRIPAPTANDYYTRVGCPNGECYGIFIEKGMNYIHVVGFEVRNIVAPTINYLAQGITVHDPSHDIVIANNWIHYIRAATQDRGNAHAIDVEGYGPVPITNIKITHNEVGPYMLNGWSECITLNGYVDGGEVSDNWVHDNTNIGIVLAGGYRHNSNPALDFVRNIKVLRNLVYNCSFIGSDGLYCDGCQSSVYQNNIVYNNINGIEVASENGAITTVNVVVDSNIAYGHSGSGALTGGYHSGAGSSDKVSFTNNVIMYNQAELNVGFHTTNFKFTGNTIVPKPGGYTPTMYFIDAAFWYGSNAIDYTTYMMSPVQIWYPAFGAATTTNSKLFSSIAAIQANAPGYDAHGQAISASVPKDLCAVPGVTCVNSVPQPLLGCPNAPITPTFAPATKAPTQPPTKAPTLPATKAPTLPPTKAPTVAPTLPPVTASTRPPYTRTPTAVATTAKATAAGSTTAAPKTTPVYVTVTFRAADAASPSALAAFLAMLIERAQQAGVVDTTVITVYKQYNTTTQSTDVKLQRRHKIHVLVGETAVADAFNVIIKIDYSPVNPPPEVIAADMQDFLNNEYAAGNGDFANAATSESDPTLGAPETAAIDGAPAAAFPIWAIAITAIAGTAIIAALVAVAVRRRQAREMKFQSNTAHAIPVTLADTKGASLSTITMTREEELRQPITPRNYMSNPMMPDHTVDDNFHTLPSASPNASPTPGPMLMPMPTSSQTPLPEHSLSPPPGPMTSYYPSSSMSPRPVPAALLSPTSYTRQNRSPRGDRSPRS